MKDLQTEMDRIVVAIVAVGHSEAFASRPEGA
jgi:hypothetical protein